MSKADRVAILILNWNGASDTLECLESVSRLRDRQFETVVIDNGSTDGSIEILRDRFPGVTLIESSRNLGFCGGNNLGIEYALERDAEFVLLLNNDTIVDPDLLGNLLAVADEHPGAGAFAARIYFYEEPTRLRFAGAEWDENRAAFSVAGYGITDEAAGTREPSVTAWGSGCGLMLRAEALRRVGGLDERYFLMWEEVDWCYRARNAGYETVHVPGAKVWHKKGRSFEPLVRGPLVAYYRARNRLLWLETHLGWRTLLRVYRRAIWADFRKWVRTLVSRDRDAAQKSIATAQFYGVLHYLVRRFGEAPAHLSAVE